MDRVTATGYQEDKDKLFVYTAQDKDGWYCFVNRFNGERIFQSTQRFESAYQAQDAGCHFVLGVEFKSNP